MEASGELLALAGVSGTVVVLGLVETIKRALRLPPRFQPLAALVLGVGWGLLTATVGSLPLGPAAVNGLVVGLGASGVWSGGKALAGR